MTSPWYFSTRALFNIVLTNNVTQTKELNYVIRIIIVIINIIIAN